MMKTKHDTQAIGAETICGNTCLRKMLFRSSLLVLLLVLGSPVRTHAQQYLATISGEVHDPSGAEISGGSIVATDQMTKFVTKTTTGSAGSYTIPSLSPGTYSVTISASGFREELRTGIVLTAGSHAYVDFSLAVGGADVKIFVTADTTLLDTASANLGDLFTLKEVTDAPNVGRNPFVLDTLAAGVTSQGFMQTKSSQYTIGGTDIGIITQGSAGHNRLTLNGIPDDPAERLSAASYSGFVPSLEAVQEVNTQTSLYDAQYGHGNGTVVNTVVRSGTNQLHGAAYYVFQNTYLNANNYERVPNQNGAINPASPTPRPNDQLNQTGFVVDGPVVIPHLYNGHDKTFFMVAYERYQTHVSLPFSTRVPIDAESNGDFSALCSNFVAGVCAAGAGIQIYDPATTNASGNRTPFLNNMIPSSRFNATGVALLKDFPEPNTSNGIFNYISNQTSYPNSLPSFIVRVDKAFSQSNKLNATFFKSGLTQTFPHQGYPSIISPTGYGYKVYRNNIGGSLDDVQVVSNTLVLDTRIGVIYHPFGLDYPGEKFDLSTIGINATGMPYQSFPGVSLSDSYSGLAAGAGGQISETTVGDLAVLATKTISRQSVRFGFEGNLIRYNIQNPLSGLGVFSFNRQFTQKNSTTTSVGADASSGDPVAALLLGYPGSGSYTQGVAYALQQIYSAFYVQDDWRLSDKLTVNAGLRWDYESPFTDRNNRQNSGFCFSCTNPLQASVSGITLNGGLQFVSSNNRFPYSRDLNNFQPRIGVAYQLSPSIVLRGGFGIIYFNTLETPIAQGFSAATGYVGTLDNTHPATSISNPFPNGITQPTGTSLGLATQVGQSVSFVDPNHRQPKETQFSVSTQTQLPGNTVLQIAYVGTRPTQQDVNRSLNFIPAQYYNQGAAGVTYLQTQVPNPMAGAIPGSAGLNAATIQRQFLLAPYPEFGGVTELYSSIGKVAYNSLEVTATKRFSHGLSVHGNFTWSKSMDQNSFYNAQDTQLARFQDQNPTLVGNLVLIYQFSALNNLPTYERLALGGWQFNTVLRAQNGSLDPAPGNVTALTGDFRVANPTYSRSFNTCYLNTNGVPVQTTRSAPACDTTSPTPAFQQKLNFTLNETNPFMDVRQVIHPLLDVSLFKQFQLRDHFNFEIRGEFFNVMNTPSFGVAGTSPGSATYGVVNLTQANDSRIAQLTGRINF